MNKDLILNVGKLMVAVAWVDGILAPQEIEVLRDVIADIPGITAQERAQVEIFMAHPVSDAERESLVQLVADLIQTDEERALVSSCLQSVVGSDGDATAEEEAMLKAIEEAIERADAGVFRTLSRVLWRGVTRQQAEPHSLVREEHIDDFMRNRVFYYLMLDPKGEALVVALGEDKARLVSLVAGLMLRVAAAAWPEGELSDQDALPQALIELMSEQIVTLYEISESQARIFLDIAWLGYRRGLDGFLLGCALEARGTEDQLHECFASLLSLSRAIGEGDQSGTAAKEELLDIAHSLLFDQAGIELAHRLSCHQTAA